MDEIQKLFYATADGQPIATLLKERLVWDVLRSIDAFEGQGHYRNGTEVENDWLSQPDEFKTLAFKFNGYWHVVYSNHPKLNEKIVLIASRNIPELIDFFNDSEFSEDVSVINWLKSQQSASI